MKLAIKKDFDIVVPAVSFERFFIYVVKTAVYLYSARESTTAISASRLQGDA
jgi:hypothetical protein